jgi:hypothetical protein
MGKHFEQEDFFPVIAEGIGLLCETADEPDAYASHDLIVEYLMACDDSAALLKNASRHLNERGLCDNAVRWWSQKFTRKDSEKIIPYLGGRPTA